MLDPDHISFLREPDGAELLRYAAALPADPLVRISRLRSHYPREEARAAVELLDLRERAASKFQDADRMFFTREGLELSSGDAAACWRASRFPAGATILDLCCGIGGDSMALARRGRLFGFDISATAAACAAANLVIARDPQHSTLNSQLSTSACADITRLRLKGDAAFFDPSRRSKGRRVKRGEQYSPPLSFIREILAAVPNLAVKVSPALDDDELESLGGRVEFVSDRGECKEAVVWFGDIGPRSERSASILPLGVTLESQDVPPVEVGLPGEWLVEPDPAIIRAHLIAEAANLLGARQLDPQIAFLTTDQPVESPFGTAYRIVDTIPFSLHRIQDRLRMLGARVEVIKRRGVPMEPEDVRQQLKPAGDRRMLLVLTRVQEKPAAILCDIAKWGNGVME